MATTQPYGKAHTRWWDPPGTTPVHEAIQDTVEFLRKADKARQHRFLRLAQLYANHPLAGLGPGDYYRVDPEADEKQKMRLDVVRAMVDAVQARIAKNKPKPTILTEGGNFALQQHAKRLERFMWGAYHRTDVYRLSPRAFRDCGVFGTGVAKVFGSGPELKVERTYPWELHIDPIEAYHGEPRSLFHTRLVDRQVLKALFPKRKREIDKADRVRDKHSADRLADQLLVSEAWRLPATKDSKDGHHFITIETADLKQEPWHEPRFPFAFVRWADPLVGFWGRGLGEEVEPIQLEINELVQKIQDAMYHLATPWIVSDKNSDAEFQIHNDPRGCHVKVDMNSERPPFVQTHQTVGPEIFQHLDRLYNRAFETAGVSQLSATSQKPAGLESGRSLLVFNDIETERFIIKGQNFERWFMDIGRLMVDAARRIERRGHKLTLKAERRRQRETVLERIDWSKVDLDDDVYDMKVFPASSLPHSPAGRVEAVQVLVKSGLIGPDDALPLLDFPDVQAVTDRKLAPYEIVLDIIESIVDDGEWVPPEPFMDLQLALPIVRNTYLRLRLKKADEDTLDMLRKWQTLAERMLGQAEAANQQQALGPQAQPAAPQNGAGAAGPAAVPQPAGGQTPGSNVGVA